MTPIMPRAPENFTSSVAYLAARRRNPIEAWPHQVYEELVVAAPWSRGPIFLCDPAIVRQVLVEDAANYARSRIHDRIARSIWGEGLLTAEGARWAWQRRTLAPGFGGDIDTLVGKGATAPVDNALRRLAEQAPVGPVIPEPLIREAVQAAIWSLVFADESPFDPALANSLGTYIAYRGGGRIGDLIAWEPVQRWRRRHRYPAALARHVDETLSRMREGAVAPVGLIGLLSGALDPDTGLPADATLVRDNVLGLLAVGAETTIQTTLWALYLLAMTPEWQRRIVDSTDDTAISRVVMEALRLYPPIAYLPSRRAIEPRTFGGIPVAAGSKVVIPIFALHRHERLWREPNRFDPDRFAAPPPRGAYLPFGAGPRVCLGSRYASALVEMIVAAVAGRFRLGLPAETSVRPVMRATLACQGLSLTMEPH